MIAPLETTGLVLDFGLLHGLTVVPVRLHLYLQGCILHVPTDQQLLSIGDIGFQPVHGYSKVLICLGSSMIVMYCQEHHETIVYNQTPTAAEK